MGTNVRPFKVKVGDAEALRAFQLLHKSPGYCPVCNAVGVFDTLTAAGATLMEGTNWIWFNSYTDSWECGECWLK